MSIFEKEKKVDYEASKEALIANGLHMIKMIYENRSSDEYKSHGDIKLVSDYNSIDKMVTDLAMIKKLPEDNLNNVKQLFLTLHRDIWSKQVSAYIVKPDATNSIYTTFYTVGYRILVAELGAIYASVDYGEDGSMTYNPTKVAERKDMSEFIACFNDDLDKNIAEFAKSIDIEKLNEPSNEKPPMDLPKVKTEAYDFDDEDTYHVYTESVVGVLEVFDKILTPIQLIVERFGKIFKGFHGINPMSLINYILSSSYDKKVEKFKDVCAMYNAMQEAYAEYQKRPKKDPKVERNYKKKIAALASKMKNLEASIKHYDSRAREETRENLSKIDSDIKDKKSSSSDNTSKKSSSDDVVDFDF